MGMSAVCQQRKILLSHRKTSSQPFSTLRRYFLRNDYVKKIQESFHDFLLGKSRYETYDNLRRELDVSTLSNLYS